MHRPARVHAHAYIHAALPAVLPCRHLFCAPAVTAHRCLHIAILCHRTWLPRCACGSCLYFLPPHGSHTAHRAHCTAGYAAALRCPLRLLGSAHGSATYTLRYGTPPSFGFAARAQNLVTACTARLPAPPCARGSAHHLFAAYGCLRWVYVPAHCGSTLPAHTDFTALYCGTAHRYLPHPHYYAPPRCVLHTATCVYHALPWHLRLRCACHYAFARFFTWITRGYLPYTHHIRTALPRTVGLPAPRTYLVALAGYYRAPAFWFCHTCLLPAATLPATLCILPACAYLPRVLIRCWVGLLPGFRFTVGCAPRLRTRTCVPYIAQFTIPPHTGYIYMPAHHTPRLRAHALCAHRAHACRGAVTTRFFGSASHLGYLPCCRTPYALAAFTLPQLPGFTRLRFPVPPLPRCVAVAHAHAAGLLYAHTLRTAQRVLPGPFCTRTTVHATYLYLVTHYFLRFSPRHGSWFRILPHNTPHTVPATPRFACARTCWLRTTVLHAVLHTVLRVVHAVRTPPVYICTVRLYAYGLPAVTRARSAAPHTARLIRAQVLVRSLPIHGLPPPARFAPVPRWFFPVAAPPCDTAHRTATGGLTMVCPPAVRRTRSRCAACGTRMPAVACHTPLRYGYRFATSRTRTLPDMLPLPLRVCTAYHGYCQHAFWTPFCSSTYAAHARTTHYCRGYSSFTARGFHAHAPLRVRSARTA